MSLNYNPDVTRTGYGRSLEINYNPLDYFSVYVESFKWDWFDFNSSFDLNNLFPDFTGAGFENRQIDSIVFYCRLEADSMLSMQIELSDTDDNKGIYIIEVPQSNDWERFAIAICDFATPPGGIPFNPSKAKFLGFTFADYVGGQPVNINESGTLYLDDIFLVENDFVKPQFQNDDDLLDFLNKTRFRFFWEAIDPVSFFIFDRHIWDDLVSVDGIGWQLASYTIAHRNQWIEPQMIEDRTEQILYNLLYKCEHTTEIDSAIAYPLRYASFKGSWAHFLNSGDLKRKNTKTEYSLFTNALLLSGVIVARQYFDNNPSIVSKADSIIAMTDWNFLYDTTENLMHFHWTPEEGLSTFKTDWFSEELDLAFLLGISSPATENRLPENPFFSNGYRRPYCEDGDYIFSAPGTGFTYWFLQMYAGFEEGTQRFQNTQNAILKDISIDQNDLGEFVNIYNSKVFGISACEGPDTAGFYLDGLDTVFVSNYHAYGYCCKFDTNNDPNGTIPIYGGLSTILFLPFEAKELANYYYYDLDSLFTHEFGYSFWSPIFSFPDAFHLDPDNAYDSSINNLGFHGPWLSVPRFPIDIGPILINTDSYLSEKGYYSGNSIRTLFSSFPPIEEQLHHFDTIEIHDMPEIVEISPIVEFPDTCFLMGEDAVFEAEIANQGNFSHEYEWLVNGILASTTSSSQYSMNVSEFEEGDTVSCHLLLPMENCDFYLGTASNQIEICTISVNIDIVRSLTSFDVSPNPAENFLDIDIGFNVKEEGILKLSNLFGQSVFEKAYHEMSIAETLDLSSLPNGVYFLSLIVEKNIITKKIIKS